jgi:predicted AlkP superfamily phosphohydrolase/phosphomutase
MFYQGGGIKSGMHHPDGMLWIRLPDRSHSVAREKVLLSAVAPTILGLLGVTPPESMQTSQGLCPTQSLSSVPQCLGVS